METISLREDVVAGEGVVVVLKAHEDEASVNRSRLPMTVGHFQYVKSAERMVTVL